MEKITENFTLEEFTRSETAERMGIQNVPGNREKLAIVNLCAKLLQPLRDIYGELNKAVGGVPNSMHQNGEASDLSIDGKARELLELIEENHLPFDQAILYRKQNFLHVSLKVEGEQREQIIIK